MSCPRNPYRTRQKLAAMAKTEVIMRDIGDFTVNDITVSTGFAQSTARDYIAAMLLDGRVIKLCDAYGNAIPALYRYGAALAPTPYDDNDDSDRPIRPVVTDWTLGSACRDALVAALFGANGRARA